MWRPIFKLLGHPLSLLAFCMLTSSNGWAQGGATLSGAVKDRSTGQPIAGAELILVRDSRKVLTDSVGRYRFPDLPPGINQFIVRAPGFPAGAISEALAPDLMTVRLIELDSTAAGREAQTLDQVTVSAAAPEINYRLADFERRRRTGRGQYLTDEEIQRSGANNLHEVVRAMRGVTLNCGYRTGLDCRIHMVRAPLNCSPDYVIDNHTNNDFGPLTPIRDIVALEVYTGPSDAPGEYTGSTAGCGVIVIWTRAGPSPRDRLR